MSESEKCPRCGNELPANFQSGVCPACLLQQGLSPSTFMSGAASDSSRSHSGNRRSWIPPTPAELAPRFPQLEILELLGQGGMGAVYKVRQRDLDRRAALKILPEEVAQDPNFAERFQREARALALLGHQHIVIVYEFGQRDGVYFLLMEYVDGVTLRQALRAGQITSADALGIVTQICDALQFAHEEGVVHRDIKPENILIDKRGRVKIADFGLAKLLGGPADVPMLTGTHQVMGTPMYMAPEQMEGTRSVDHRADIFSLGVVFYELLTGELPLGRFAPPSQKYQLDVRLDEVVLRTLEKEPNRRYQQASEVKCDVESIRSPVISPQEKQKMSWAQKRFWLSLAILGGLLAIALFKMIPPFPVTNYAKLQKTINELQNEKNNLSLQLLRMSTISPPALQQNPDGQPASDDQSISDDPNEALAIVQFSDEKPRLNPNFATEVLTSEHRQSVNEILSKVHDRYLALEKTHTKFERRKDQTVLAEIAPFPDEVAELENELWTALDSQLSRPQQKFLRNTLPLYSELTQPPPLIDSSSQRASEAAMEMMASGGMGMGMGAMMGGASNMPPAMPGGMSPMGGEQRHEFGLYARYPQLLGWKASILPLRITMGRRGKWFRWSIENDKFSEKFSDGTVRDQYQQLDSGEAPDLPTGLRRFWKFQTLEAPVLREESKFEEIPTVEPPATPSEPSAPEIPTNPAEPVTNGTSED
ncbi:serine/threonine-protein kinase [Schlesneria sp. T3-172]|uniref:serine/threonine-protein kinase n=1 Tax=Schlesneria sphaerica TaxID=3373610 RepID=UPI0037C71CB5